jgi:prepilin-type N-terminal cleavage/methylation domain-containing protein
MSVRAGVTLVELLVVIAILALTTALSSVALRRIDAPREPDAADVVRALRREALAAGRPVTGVVHRDGNAYVVAALADGRVSADSALHLDAATGLPDVVAP